MEIQTAVHKIYQQLSVTLERALQANKHHIGNPECCCIELRSVHSCTAYIYESLLELSGDSFTCR